MHFGDYAHGVSGTVEKIGIAEGDVFGAPGDLPADVFQHDSRLNNPKGSAIDRDDGAMPAKMFAAPARFSVARAMGAAVDMKLGVSIEWRQLIARRGDEVKFVERYECLGLRRVCTTLEAIRKGDQTRLELAAEDGLHAEFSEVRFV